MSGVERMSAAGFIEKQQMKQRMNVGRRSSPCSLNPLLARSLSLSLSTLRSLSRSRSS
jgi:hypothetical protein